MTDILDKRNRDDEIFKSRLIGNSPRSIAEHFDLTVSEVEAIIDRKMVKVDHAYRLRVLSLDLERLETLQARFLRDALGGNLAAGHLCLKIAERKAAMLGTDAPVRIDVTATAAPKLSTTQEIESILDEILDRNKPALPPQGSYQSDEKQ